MKGKTIHFLHFAYLIRLMKIRGKSICKIASGTWISIDEEINS